jgi:hypothetical protein
VRRNAHTPPKPPHSQASMPIEQARPASHYNDARCGVSVAAWSGDGEGKTSAVLSILISHLTQVAPIRDVWGDNVSASPSLRKVS